MKKLYARSLEGHPLGDWQLLEKHLNNTARLAEAFASSFNAGDWGRLAGLWHDLGKCRPAFQARLRGEKIQAQHSDLGAALAYHRDRRIGIIAAFAVAGHHAGLANLRGGAPGLPTPLMERISLHPEEFDILSGLPVSLIESRLPEVPAFLRRMAPGSPESKRALEVFIRFLFSALVDADRLDSEHFAEPGRSMMRGGEQDILELRRVLDAFIEERFSRARVLEMGSLRQAVLSACRDAAVLDPGAFSLTVPTGGGKTLSAMAFALRHAEAHGMRRVLAVIPYTSIIEQNAAVYREALGADNILEHHSAVDAFFARSEEGRPGLCRHELAEENWDMPVVVTTSVQFFESLFSNRSGRCRKIHNISRSVIILDEIQAIPPEFLLPILDMLKELIRHYRCSVVLSTATPPALAAREGFPQGLEQVREIIPDPAALSRTLSRVNYHWPEPDSSPISWEELADEAARHPRVLTITHRRSDARELARLLGEKAPGDPLFHLSALMCPAHRLERLREIKRMLAGPGPCRVVSTQLVEAGVDMDFPVVYRALGGLDSMVQAAGRCNREARLEKGLVKIFRAESRPPPGTPRKALETTEQLLRAGGGHVDISDPSVFETYFRKLYASGEMDARGIQALRQELKFASVGCAFRLIEDGHIRTVVAPWGKAAFLLSELRARGPHRRLMRSLGMYSVSIYPQAFTRLRDAGALEEVYEGIFTLSSPFIHLYDEDFGLLEDSEPTADPGSLVV